MKRVQPADKWQRAMTARSKKRKANPSWISYGQLYREISAGYERFLAARIRTGTLKDEARV